MSVFVRRVNECKAVKRRKHKERMDEKHISRRRNKKNIFSGTKTSANKTIKKTFFAIFIRSISFYSFVNGRRNVEPHWGVVEWKIKQPKKSERNAKFFLFIFPFTWPFQNINERMDLTNEHYEYKHWRTYFYSLFDSVLLFFFIYKKSTANAMKKHRGMWHSSKQLQQQQWQSQKWKMHLIILHFY